MISVIVPICVSVVMMLLLSASKKRAQRDEERNLILKLPKLYLITGIVCSIFFNFLLVISNVQARTELWVTSAFLLFIILGLWMAIYAITYVVIVSEEYLERTNILGKTNRLYFNEIESVSFNRTSFELKIGNRLSKMKVHLHVIGFQELLEAIETKTSFNRKNMGIPDHLL